MRNVWFWVLVVPVKPWEHSSEFDVWSLDEASQVLIRSAGSRPQPAWFLESAPGPELRWSTLLCWLSRSKLRGSASNTWRTKTTSWRWEPPIRLGFKENKQLHSDFIPLWGITSSSPPSSLNSVSPGSVVSSGRRRRCTLSWPRCLLFMWPNYLPRTNALKSSLAPSTARRTSCWRLCCRWVPTLRWWTSQGNPQVSESIVTTYFSNVQIKDLLYK